MIYDIFVLCSNCSPNGKSPCLGTDPNRNWEFHWGEAGASTQPCSDSYQGPKAASEVGYL